MKIAIVGQGAIASLMSYYFAALQPTFLVRTPNADANTLIDLQGHEIALTQLRLPVSGPGLTAIDTYAFDALIIVVKGYHLPPLIEQIKPWLSETTRLILIQNGMGGAQLLATAFPQNLIYAGTTTDAVYELSARRYQITAIGRLDIGPFWDMLPAPAYAAPAILARPYGREKEKRWIDTCLSHHPHYLYHDNVAPALHTKLAINAVINPLTAILQVKNGELQKHSNDVATLKHEIFSVYQAADIEHSPKALDFAINIVIDATAQNWSSMCQDIQRHRLTENDTVLGYLLSLAKAHQVSTPFMLGLYQQIALLDALASA